jgi:hypothetical protein
MLLGISGTDNFLLVFQAEHSILSTAALPMPGKGSCCQPSALAGAFACRPLACPAAIMGDAPWRLLEDTPCRARISTFISPCC